MIVPDTGQVSMRIKIAALLAFYAAATLICACLLVILLRSGAFAAVDVLFYRGLAALAMSGSLLLAMFWILVRRLPEGLGLSARDAVGAAASSSRCRRSSTCCAAGSVTASAATGRGSRSAQTHGPATSSSTIFAPRRRARSQRTRRCAR